MLLFRSSKPCLLACLLLKASRRIRGCTIVLPDTLVLPRRWHPSQLDVTKHSSITWRTYAQTQSRDLIDDRQTIVQNSQVIWRHGLNVLCAMWCLEELTLPTGAIIAWCRRYLEISCAYEFTNFTSLDTGWTIETHFFSIMQHRLFRKNLKSKVFDGHVISRVYCSM